MIRVEFVRAWPQRHESVVVEVAEDATVGEALRVANWALDAEFIGLAVFGVAATVETALHEGDRIELLRGLQLDPKQARRMRAERAKQRR